MLKDIKELTTQFKRLDGKFENAEIRYSEETGYRCDSLDSKKSTLISCPEKLFVDIDDIDISEAGLFITRPENYGSNITFLNSYFRFQFNRKVILRYSEIKRQIASLPKKDLPIISNIFPPSLLDVKKYGGLTYEKKRIIESHNIRHLNKKVIMPFVTFLNYGKNGNSYNIEDDRISVSGKFNGEILALYNDDDVLKIASGYGFITDTKAIYSIPLTYKLKNGKTLVINNKTTDAVQLGDGSWKPLVKIEEKSITLSWFPLHLEGAPMFSVIIAKMIADEINIPAENLIYNIIKLNLHALIPAAFQLCQSENAFSRYLGEAAKRQLETISSTR